MKIKKTFGLIAIIAVLFTIPFMAQADSYRAELNGAIGGYIQAQGGIDVYLENAAIQAGPIAASANVTYVQAAGQVQAMGAYVPSVETYEYHQNYDNYGYYYNNYDQFQSYVEPTELNIRASQVYEKFTTIQTPGAIVTMNQSGIQTGIISITTGNYNNQYN